jgi:hypothetical protein
MVTVMQGELAIMMIADFHKLHKSTGYPNVQDTVGKGKGWENGRVGKNG